MGKPKPWSEGQLKWKREQERQKASGAAIAEQNQQKESENQPTTSNEQNNASDKTLTPRALYLKSYYENRKKRTRYFEAYRTKTIKEWAERKLIVAPHLQSKAPTRDVWTQVNFYANINSQINNSEQTNVAKTKQDFSPTILIIKKKPGSQSSEWTVLTEPNSNKSEKEVTTSLVTEQIATSNLTLDTSYIPIGNYEQDKSEIIIPNTPPAYKSVNEKIDQNNLIEIHWNNDEEKNPDVEEIRNKITNKFKAATNQASSSKPLDLSCRKIISIEQNSSNPLSDDFKKKLNTTLNSNKDTFQQAETVVTNPFSNNKEQVKNNSFASLWNVPSTSSSYSAVQKCQTIIEKVWSDEEDISSNASEASVQILN